MIKDYKKILITIIALILITPNITYATTEFSSTSSYSIGAPPVGGGNGYTATTAGTYAYCQNNGTDIEITNTVAAEVYATEGNSIGSALTTIDSNYYYYAGRFIGLDIYEKYKKKITVKVYSGWATTTLKCAEKKKKCKPGTGIYVGYDGKEISPNDLTYTGNGNAKVANLQMVIDDSFENDGGGTWIPCEYEYYNANEETVSCQGCSCPSGKELINSKTTYSPNPGGLDACLEQFTPGDTSIDEVSPAFKVTYYNSNDINDKSKTQQVPSTSISIEGPTTIKNGANGKVTKTLIMIISYNLPKACVNVKTGLVEYKKSCEKDEELAARFINQSEDGISKYFIPLNAKSDSNFTFFMESSNETTAKRDADTCIGFIDKYPTYWRNLLRRIDGTQYNKNDSVAKIKDIIRNTDKGCKYGISAQPKILQSFYNEEEKNKVKTLEGYRFYYRPIDYAKPFPNGIQNGSYWNGLYDSKTNTVTVKDQNNKKTVTNLNSSFEKLTYLASDIKLDSIRQFNKQHFYTSWDNMNINGKSGFIGTGYGVTRVGQNEFYKLGCGPSNAKWAECNKKTEVNS